MVYVVSVDEPVPVLGRRGGRPYFTKTVPTSELMRSPTRLALVLAKRRDSQVEQGERTHQLTHLGAVVRSSGQKVSTYDRLLKVEEVFALPGGPLDIAQIIARLPTEGRELLSGLHGGSVRILSKEIADATVNAVRMLRPDAAPIMDWLEALDLPAQFGNDLADRFWQFERDAANIALHIADMSPTPLRAWERPEDENQPFFAGIVPIPALPGNDAGEGVRKTPADLLGLLPHAGEQAMIEHDARTFAGWRNLDRKVHIHSFSDGERSMEIANVNASRVEARIGVDLIYYHVNTASFVLVQYKRLIDNKHIWVDKRLSSQLDRMEKLAMLNKGPECPDQWRIGPDFAFVKLAQDREPDRAAFGMVPGLYLPLSYVSVLLCDDTTLGDHGGRKLGYGSVGRYLSNKQFIDLVAHGLVGTVRISVEELRGVVDGLLNDGDSLIIATDHSSETTVERQRRLRSRDPKRSTSRPE